MFWCLAGWCGFITGLMSTLIHHRIQCQTHIPLPPLPPLHSEQLEMKNTEKHYTIDALAKSTQSDYNSWDIRICIEISQDLTRSIEISIYWDLTRSTEISKDLLIWHYTFDIWCLTFDMPWRSMTFDILHLTFDRH